MAPGGNLPCYSADGEEDGAGDFCMAVDGRDTRGFAMRRGRCRRLRADFGRESYRGRAAFARSVNAPSRRDSRTFLELGRQTVSAKRRWLSSLQAVSQEAVAEVEAVLLEHTEDLQEAPCNTAPPPPRPPRLRRSSSVPCTAAERRKAEGRAALAAIPLSAWRLSALLKAHVVKTPKKRASSLWDRATAAAAAAAAASSAAMAATASCSSGKAGSPRRRGIQIGEGSVLSDFKALQRRFLEEHGSLIKSRLQDCLGQSVKLLAAPLSLEVMGRFVKAYGIAEKASLRPVYHGTEAKNHRSIFNQGLLVPGERDHVQVCNGLSHGRGIYTSIAESPWLSKGFCTEPKMLVCGVLDDAVQMRTPIRIGNFMVTKESRSVRHVGAAIVVFDSARLVPFFEAVWQPVSSCVQRAVSSVVGLSASAASATKTEKRPPSTRRPTAAAALTSRSLAAVTAFLARRAARRRRV